MKKYSVYCLVLCKILHLTFCFFLFFNVARKMGNSSCDLLKYTNVFEITEREKKIPFLLFFFLNFVLLLVLVLQ